MTRLAQCDQITTIVCATFTQWLLVVYPKVFAEGKDIYCASASQMFGVPVEKHGINGHLRQKGKIAELTLGYGGSVGALKSMGALEIGLSEEELQPLVNSWRSSNPMITAFWQTTNLSLIFLILVHFHIYKTCNHLSIKFFNYIRTSTIL